MLLSQLADNVSCDCQSQFQIETGDDEGDNEDEDEDEEDEEQQQTVDWSYGISKVKEMRLVPSDSSQCMFVLIFFLFVMLLFLISSSNYFN